MISTAFEYQRANSLDEAIKKLQETGGKGKLLAGGHSLVPLMKLRMSEPGILIDIAKIPGLAGIREKDGKIEIFAATVHHDVASSSLLADKCPIVAETAGEIGDPQVRNRGTLGGSLAPAAPGRVRRPARPTSATAGCCAPASTRPHWRSRRTSARRCGCSSTAARCSR